MQEHEDSDCCRRCPRKCTGSPVAQKPQVRRERQQQNPKGDPTKEILGPSRPSTNGPYNFLQGASFSTYRDLREPIVRISEDGSLGWLIAEVEVVGTVPDQDNGRSSFHDIWAWIELYEKTDQDWRLIGNVSNRR